MLKLGQKLLKKNSWNRKKIMVRCKRSNSIVYREEGEEDEWKILPVYDCYDYYLVDLKSDRDESILRRHCEPLLDNDTRPGNFFCMGSFIYSIPFIMYCEYDYIPPSLPYPNNGEMINRLSQIFTTTLDKSYNPKKWTASIDVPQYFHCAPLSGAIYGVESGNVKNALCFVPSENCWTPTTAPPPTHLHNCGVSGKLIPDPKNDRILVHLFGGNLTEATLYAWHPKTINEKGDGWIPLESFTTNLWFDGTTLINFDDKSLLIFFFNDIKDLFKVWCLEDRKFLEISWCKRIPRLRLRAVQAHTMCYLGKNQLCLALSFPPVVNNDIRITFLIFDIKHLPKSGMTRKGKEPAVERKGKEPATDASSDSMITFTYVSSKSFQALDTRCAIDISPLGDVY